MLKPTGCNPADHPPRPGVEHDEDVPVSKAQMRDRLKQLAEPPVVLEVKPEGSVRREMRTEQDQSGADEIQRTQERLAERRHTAKNAFNRSR